MSVHPGQNHENVKCFLCNSIELYQHGYDSLLANKVYTSRAVLKGPEMFNVKEVLAKVEKTLKYGKTKFQQCHQDNDQLIKKCLFLITCL